MKRAILQYKMCSKKDRTFAIKTLLLILQHFKHCSLQSSPLYWRYTIPNISSIVRLLPGTHFLWWRTVLLLHFPESPLWLENDILSKWFTFAKQVKTLLGLSPENRVDGHNRCLMFRQITADEDWRMSLRIVMVQHPSLVFPQFRPIPAHSIPPTR